mgnify:CR=1 FL=1
MKVYDARSEQIDSALGDYFAIRNKHTCDRLDLANCVGDISELFWLPHGDVVRLGHNFDR